MAATTNTDEKRIEWILGRWGRRWGEGVRELEGLGLKMCELWKSPPGPPPYPEYACLVLYTINQHSIFLINLGSGGSGSSSSGGSDGLSSPGGGSDGFSSPSGGSSGGGIDSVYPIDICPNLRIPWSFGNVQCCVVKSTLYIFRMAQDKTALGFRPLFNYPPDVTGADVYSLGVGQLIKYSDAELDETMLKKHAISMSFKTDPVPLPFLDGILFFSTKILFDGVLDNVETFDFELYDPTTVCCTRLPSLRIRPQTNSKYCKTFQLFHPHSGWEDFPILSRAVINPFFSIHSYAIHQTEFLIQTDFGRMFSIDIVSPNAEWRLLDQGLSYRELNARGLRFRGWGHHFIASDGRVCMDAYGVNTFRDEHALKQKSVDFPLPFVSGVHRSITLLDARTPCFIQVGPNASHFESSCGEPGTPNWCLDLFKVDFDKLLMGGDKNEDDERKEHMERITSFKFCAKNQHVYATYFLGLFPCRICTLDAS